MCEYIAGLFILKIVQEEKLNDICLTNEVEYVDWPFDLHISRIVYRYIKGN